MAQRERIANDGTVRRDHTLSIEDETWHTLQYLADRLYGKSGRKVGDVVTKLADYYMTHAHEWSLDPQLVTIEQSWGQMTAEQRATLAAVASDMAALTVLVGDSVGTDETYDE